VLGEVVVSGDEHQALIPAVVGRRKRNRFHTPMGTPGLEPLLKLRRKEGDLSGESDFGTEQCDCEKHPPLHVGGFRILDFLLLVNRLCRICL
jgi:hypothetical protein